MRRNGGNHCEHENGRYLGQIRKREIGGRALGGGFCFIPNSPALRAAVTSKMRTRNTFPIPIISWTPWPSSPAKMHSFASRRGPDGAARVSAGGCIGVVAGLDYRAPARPGDSRRDRFGSRFLNTQPGSLWHLKIRQMAILPSIEGFHHKVSRWQR